MQKNKSINKEGIGLGLYITQNLAIQLGGMIGVDSEEGTYTRFFVALPINGNLQQAKDQGLLKLKAGFVEKNEAFVAKLLENDEKTLESVRLTFMDRPPTKEAYVEPNSEKIETERALCLFTDERDIILSEGSAESFQTEDINFQSMNEEKKEGIKLTAMDAGIKTNYLKQLMSFNEDAEEFEKHTQSEIRFDSYEKSE